MAATALVMGILALAIPAQSSAQTLHLKIVSLPLVTRSPLTIEVKVEVSNFTLNCQEIGHTNKAGRGLDPCAPRWLTHRRVDRSLLRDTFTILVRVVAAV